MKRWDPWQSYMGNWAGMSVANEQASALWELMKCSVQNVSPPGTVCASLLEFNPFPRRCLGSIVPCLLNLPRVEQQGQQKEQKAPLIIKLGEMV